MRINVVVVASEIAESPMFIRMVIWFVVFCKKLNACDGCLQCSDSGADSADIDVLSGKCPSSCRGQIITGINMSQRLLSSGLGKGILVLIHCLAG